ncbi:fructose 1,6-bisphosphatase, partial [candidate division WOR-3 bacterium]|nr:fructose 1,6-bisphosphatase [candidate division WOR-3 bacterium]
MAEKITLSAIKADVGGFVGHSSMHPALMEKATESLESVKNQGLIIDFCVTHCGDDLELIMTHEKGTESGEI